MSQTLNAAFAVVGTDASKVVAWPGRGPLSQYAGVPDRHGSLRRRLKSRYFSLSQKGYVQLDAMDILAKKANCDLDCARLCSYHWPEGKPSKVVASPVL